VRWVSYAAAADPTLTGLFLFASPTLFAWLILGTEVSATGEALGRIGGGAMFAVGLAAWPVASPTTHATRALLIYNAVATGYLCYLGSVANLAGFLLWPAVIVHAALVLLLMWNLLADSRDRVSREDTRVGRNSAQHATGVAMPLTAGRPPDAY
jgi:hypothetical protein